MLSFSGIAALGWETLISGESVLPAKARRQPMRNWVGLEGKSKPWAGSPPSNCERPGLCESPTSVAGQQSKLTFPFAKFGFQGSRLWFGFASLWCAAAIFPCHQSYLIWEAVDKVGSHVKFCPKSGIIWSVRAAPARFPYAPHMSSRMCPFANGELDACVRAQGNTAVQEAASDVQRQGGLCSLA